MNHKDASLYIYAYNYIKVYKWEMSSPFIEYIYI